MSCREIALAALAVALASTACGKDAAEKGQPAAAESGEAAADPTGAESSSSPAPTPSTPGGRPPTSSVGAAIDRPALSDAERGKRIQTYLAAVDRACDSGVEASCWFQGIVYSRGLLDQKVDRARAADYFKRGCGDLGGPACPEMLAPKSKLDDKERAALSALCGRGRIDACRRVGGSGADKALCNAGVLERCAGLAADPGAAGKEPAAPALPETAGEPAKKAAAACDAGEPHACAILARAYLDGAHGLPANPERAFALGGRACERDGATLGCYPAAAARLATATTAREMNAALGIARKGCERGDMKACAIIARALERSADADSRQRGLSFWLMACHLPADRPAGEPDPAACAEFEQAVPHAVK